jgi:hypothetical protein
MTKTDTQNEHGSRTDGVIVRRLERSLPWFRIVFGSIGLLKPRLLGKWYGIYSPEGNGPNEVAIRYFSIRAIALGIGRVIAPPAQRERWERLSILGDSTDTVMVAHAGLTEKIPWKRAVGMLCGTVFATAVGMLRERTRQQYIS